MTLDNILKLLLFNTNNSTNNETDFEILDANYFN